MSDKSSNHILLVAVDFDGTCVTHEYPKVGRHIGAPRVLHRIVKEGGLIILWTMRSGQHLQDAVKWFEEQGIPLYGIQRNPTQDAWTDSPKCYAKIYIDDAALGCPLKPGLKGERPYVDWDAVEALLWPVATTSAVLGQTPETDAVLAQYAHHLPNWLATDIVAAKARSLERQRDAAKATLDRIDEIYIDGENTHDDWKAMGELARNFSFDKGTEDDAEKTRVITYWNPPLDCSHEALVAYIRSMKGGERVVETQDCMKGCEGTVEIKDGCVRIRWDHQKYADGEGVMVTSFTGGARIIPDRSQQETPTTT